MRGGKREGAGRIPKKENVKRVLISARIDEKDLLLIQKFIDQNGGTLSGYIEKCVKMRLYR